MARRPHPTLAPTARGLEDPLAEEILRGTIQNNSLVTVKANKDKDALTFSGKEAAVKENSSEQ